MARESDSQGGPAPLWDPCPPGEFERLSGNLRRRRQRRNFLKGAAVAAATALVGGGLWLLLRGNDSSDPPLAGIKCDEVQRLAQAYMRSELDSARREQVRRHVAQCPRCRQLFESMGVTL